MEKETVTNLHYLEPLNPEQRQAVLHTGKPLLILAGAGSGKTRVITTKIAWLIGEQGIDPYSILAVTFTNKAAKEMAERARQIDPRAEGTMLRTFHSFGAWFLRRNGSIGGLGSDFVIYDDDDVVSLLSTLMENTPKVEVKDYAHKISRAKDYFLLPDDPMLKTIDSRKKFREVYARYEERMAQIGNVDFGDLIKKPVEILRAHPEVAERFRQRFSVIMVDEYQDTNVAQFHLLKELCGKDTYVCVVGDDDQSIYRFRGAEVKNILEFPGRFSNADIIRLEQNYRSFLPILQAASSVVDHNKGRLGKTLRAEKGNGPLPILTYLQNQDEEANYCADLIKKSVSKKETKWSDWAILYRTNAQSRCFETTFLHRKIPYRIIGSLKFYEREEIKDSLSLLAFLVNPRDEVAFRRVVNKPTRGVGRATVDRIVEEGTIKNNNNLIEAGRKIELTKNARKGLEEFFLVIEEAHELLLTPPIEDEKKVRIRKKKDGLVAGDGLSQCVSQLIMKSGIAGYHQKHNEDTWDNRLSNLQELVNMASEYTLNREGLLEFLETIELDRSLVDEQQNTNDDSITLITFHNTKGLEFNRVIMTGLEQGIFPRDEKKGEELEEERRLFYVGATRAMNELYLTSCKQRLMYGQNKFMDPSLFLHEIDSSCLMIQGIGEKRKFNEFVLDTANSELEERAGWRRGQRLFHEDNGYGAVVEVKDSEDGPIVRVRFDNGSEKRFLSEYQGRAYEKITEE